MFGANKPAGFSGFGTSSTSAFGNIGSTSTGFGGGTSFGATGNTSSLFGATPSATPGGGGLFGQTASTGFGQPAQQTGGAFSFGATPSSNSGGMFGNTGQTATGGSLFSTPAASSSGFGGFGSKSGFGGATTQAASTGGGLFGGATAAAPSFSFGGATPSQGGSTIAFIPPAGQDTMMKGGSTTSINTRHQCITAMKEYETKSIEELRTEDYTANRKTKQPGTTATGGMFGQTPAATPASGTGFMFGGTAGGLGASSSTGFGGFGTQSAAATTPFNQNKSLFGTASTIQPAGFGGLGTATGTQQSSSLFGNTAKPLFGGTQSTQPALGSGGSSFFGAGTGGTATSIGFGASTQSGGLFGNKPTGFGTATTAGGLGGFGTAAGGGLFGKPTATASSFGFGTNTSTSGFGGTSTGLFNKPGGFGTTATGLGTGTTGFGFGAGTLGAGTTNTFGAANTSKPGGFGAFNFGQANTGGAGGFGTLGAGTGTNSFAFRGGGGLTLGTSNVAAQNSNAQMGQHLLALASSPYGDNPLFWNLKQKTKEGREDVLRPTNPNAQKAVLSSTNQYKVSPRPTAKIKPKSLHGLMNGGKAHLFDGLDDEDSSFGDDTFVPRKSVKKLVLRKGSGNKSTSDSSSFLHDVTAPPLPYTNGATTDLNNSQPITRSINLEQGDRSSENVITTTDTPARDLSRMPPVHRLFADNTNLNDSISCVNNKSPLKEVPLSQCLPSDPAGNSYDGNASPHNRLAADMTTSFFEASDLDNSCLGPESMPPHPTGIVCTRPDYYTIPSLDEITNVMDENGKCLVEDFTIGREGYGNLFFPGVTNMTAMNLDEIVHFRRKEVVVYPDDEKKPPLGEGLNKKAQITLDCVWPMDKTSRTPITSPERLKVINYGKKIEETTSRIGGKFIDYRIETGSWVFEVNHFSKYGLLDDSDEEEMTEQQKKLLAGQQNSSVALAQKLKIQQKHEQLMKESMSHGQGDALGTCGGTGAVLMDGEMLEGGEGDNVMAMNENSISMAPNKLLSSAFEEDEFNSSLDSKYLASTMGVSAKHIQGMKASFFTDDYGGYEGYGKKKERRMEDDMESYDEEMSAVWKKKDKTISSSLFGAFKHPASLSLPQSPAFSDKEKEGYEPTPFHKSVGLFDSVFFKDSKRPTPQTFLHPPIMEHPLVPSGLKTEDMLLPKVVGTQVRHSFLHVKDSLLYNNQKTLVDAACYMGRSFRVGWGPSWTVAHFGYPMGLEEEEINEVSLLPLGRRKMNTLPRFKRLSVQVEKVQMAGYMDVQHQIVLNQQEELLRVQLDNSQIKVEDGCPLLVPQPGVEALHQLSATLKANLAEIGSHPDAVAQHQAKTVLTLCEALWGDLPDAENLEISETYRESQLRREAFSSWLSEVSTARVADEMESCSSISSEGCLKAIFSKLSVREISSACLLAQKGRDHRLALLIAQAMGGPETRQLLKSQLDRWAELDVCQFIKEERQKIYCLLAGEMVWSCEDRDINTCHGLDWKRALALHLWYKCQPNASIHQALTQYHTGFKGSDTFGAYCASPLPPYLEEEELGDNECIYDTAYHLICLYCDNTYSLEGMLSPTSSTASHMDYRLSWHLLQILQALQYQHLSPEHTDSIHTSFASQLEALGLWQWAAFVLLHICNSAQRQRAIQALLQRHLKTGETFTKEEVFLVEKLLVPVQWLHQAKAIRAHHEGNHHAEARHLLLAESWNKAHHVVLRHIAPDAIINDDHDYLRGFLDPMASPDCRDVILNWTGNGKVFLDFINLRKRLNQLKQSQPTAYDIEALQPDVLSLCSRVKGLVCNNAKDYLCQAEMAKTAANLVRTFLTLQGQSPTSLLTKIIPDLPMPEDFSLQELQALSATALMEIA